MKKTMINLINFYYGLIVLDVNLSGGSNLVKNHLRHLLGGGLDC